MITSLDTILSNSKLFRNEFISKLKILKEDPATVNVWKVVWRDNPEIYTYKTCVNIAEVQTLIQKLLEKSYEILIVLDDTNVLREVSITVI